jgi:enoyl-[acyl-carrier protein] reductase/trans-2-enoyl-CoA reductase (NAD+)
LELEGYRSDFHNLFGFGFDGVDYEADADEMVGVNSMCNTKYKYLFS